MNEKSNEIDNSQEQQQQEKINEINEQEKSEIILDTSQQQKQQIQDGSTEQYKPTVEEMIDKDQPSNHLRSINSLLQEDSNINSNLRKSINKNYEDEFELNIDIIIYNIKDFIMMLILILSPSLNFNYLYLPYLCTGFLYYSILFDNFSKSRNFKSCIELTLLIYSIFLLGFKITFMVLINKGNSFIEEHRNMFINLGISYLLADYNKYYLFSTFIGESVVLLFSLVAIIISKTMSFTDEDNKILNQKKIKQSILFSKMMKYFFGCYLFMIGFALFNRSLLTLLYLIPINLFLFLYAVDINKKSLYNFFRIISKILLFFLIVELFILNFSNIYTIAYKYFDINSNENTPLFVQKYWRKLGFYFAYYTNMETFWKDWWGYCFASLSIVMLSIIIKEFSVEKLILYSQPDEEEEGIDDNDSNKSDDEESCWSGFIKYISNFCSSSYFILHLCRFMGIIWLFAYRNFYSLGVFIWLFFSFLYLHINNNKFWSTFVLVPTLCISLISFHLSSIQGYFEIKDEVEKIKYMHFALGKYSYDYLRYVFANFFYFFITIFINSLSYLDKQILKDYKYQQTVKEQEKNSNKNINNQEQNNNINNELNDIRSPSINDVNDDEEEGQKKIISDNIEKTDENNNNKSGFLPMNIVDNSNSNISPNKKGKLETLNHKIISESYDEDSKINLEDENLTLYNIILKNIFANIDKITLIVMYFVAFKTINIIHLVLVFIFMLQLLLPNYLPKLCVLIIQILQLLYLIEYIMDLLKVYKYISFGTNIVTIEFFMLYNKDLNETSIEIFLYGIIYCFYIQYQLYNQKTYQKLVVDDNINISNYFQKIIVENNFNEIFSKIISMIENFIEGIYIWIIIIFFIWISCFFEVNLIFGIKLGLFFISLFYYLSFVQEPLKRMVNVKISQFAFIFAGINTLLVYIYQVLCLPLIDFGTTVKNSNNFFIKNLPNIGFTSYKKDQLYYKLLPHFLSNFLCLLYFWEMKRLETNTEKQRLIFKNKIRKIIRQEDANNNVFLDKDQQQQEEEKEKEDKEKEKEEDKKKSPAEQYKENNDRMIILNLQNIAFKIIKTITQSCWLFNFLAVCIVITVKDLSIAMIIYILIFGFIYIRMFYNIVISLENFLKKDSYFISKVIHFSLIEEKYHIRQNKYFRRIAFRYLFGFNCICLFIYYISGVFDLVENGCNPEVWKECDPSHSSMFDEGGSFAKDCIISLSYLFGVYVNLRKNGILTASWAHLLLFGLICFDIYIQKLEIYITELSVNNRKEYQQLANENIKLKPLTLLGTDNILVNIQNIIKKKQIEETEKKQNLRVSDINTTTNIITTNTNIENNINNNENNINNNIENDNNNNALMKVGRLLSYDQLFGSIKSFFDSKGIKVDQFEERKGKKYIVQFLEAFKKAMLKDIQLSDANNKYKIIKGIKQIFEEIIIFLLICTAISKLNIWSFIYMIISIYFISSKKSNMKIYLLFCFILFAITLQSIIFISNLQEQTDPNGNKEIIDLIEKTLNIPWYRKFTDDKNGFFLGLGVNKLQINLIWMDFVEVLIIYIYLDLFTYSIYQDVQNKGSTVKGNNKINFYNLYLNKKVKESVEHLGEKEFKKHHDCMKYDFNINLGDYEEFRSKVLLIRQKKDVNELEEIKEKKKENESENEDSGFDGTNTNINFDINRLSLLARMSQTQIKTKSSQAKTLDEEMQKALEESPLLKKLNSSRKLACASHNLLQKSNEGKNNKTFFDMVKELLYLSMHNVILIIIMIISMMVSGLLSIFYIVFSLYFLMKSNLIYFGKPYGYPHAIKRILRVAILIDIAIQALYQTPFINPSSGENGLYLILRIIGFNKIINFGKNNAAKEFEIYIEQMILVVAKAFTYLFISIQILIYSSQDFQEYYLSYILTKNENLKKTALMKVFRFNNKRIEVMGRSISLRQDMTKAMDSLQDALETWTQKLAYMRQSSSIKQTEKDKNKIIDDNKNKEQEQAVDLRQTIKKECEKKEGGENIPEQEEKKEKEMGLFQLLGVKENDNKENKEEKKKDKYVPYETVKKLIKEWILGGKLIQIQLWLHKNSASYSYIDENEKDEYERDVIQGKTKITSFIENLVEQQLNTLDLSNFTEEEMPEVKKYFDGTRRKQLEKIKQEKEKSKKLLKVGNQVKFISQIKNDILDNNKEKKETKEESNIFKEAKKDIEEKENNIDLNQPKFVGLDKFVTNELFTKYLSNSYILSCIVTDCLCFCSNSFNWLCYSIMIIDHMCNASIISLFYPLSIFGYAILEYPRPKKTYWNICLTYTVIIILIKFIVQLQLFQKIFEDDENLNADGTIANPYKDFIDNLNHYKLGLVFSESTFSLTFFNYIVYDALVIIFLLINNYLLVTNGIWTQREQEIETVYQAIDRVASTEHLKIDSIDDIKVFNSKYLKAELMNKVTKKSKTAINLKGKKTQQKIKPVPTDVELLKEKSNKQKMKAINTVGNLLGMNKTQIIKDNKNQDNNTEKKSIKLKDKPSFLIKYDEEQRNYYERLFPRIRNEKPGHEYYASYTISMLFIIIFLILFYTNMNQDKTYNAVSVDINQFSGSMVIFLIIHVIFLVYDRIIFVCQNRNNLKYEYIIYDKKKCASISENEFNRIKSDITLKYPNQKRERFYIPFEYIETIKNEYNIHYIQTEEFNIPLLQKYILHLIIVIFSHGFIFFYLPMQGNINIRNSIYCLEGEECNDFVYNPALIFFYIFYVIYLTGSALQVKYGFYDMKRKSMLKSGNSSISGGIYAGYKAIPFLYEIKLAIDWTFTSTCLDLFQWNKYESVYDTIYATYCSMTAKNNQLVGIPVGKILKVGMGGTLSFTLVLLLVVPLLLFSSLNPTNELNNLTGATLKIDLSFFYKNGATKNYTLYENSKPESINTIYPGGEEEWQKYNYSKSAQTKNFPQEQVQSVQFFIASDRNWRLAKPHISSLIEELEQREEDQLKEIQLIMDYTFERLLPVEARKPSNRFGIILFNNENNEKYINQTKKIDEIKNALLYCNTTSVLFENLYNAALRLTANIDPKIIEDEKYISTFDVRLGFTGCKIEEGEINYLESYFTLEKENKDGIDNEGVIFHVFSDKVSSSTSGYSVLTFYVSFILLAGTYVRNFFAGQPETIKLSEMPHPEDLINLCEGIKVSRYSFDYEQEEKLYYILIELMRSPDYLRFLTKSSTEQFKKRYDLTKRTQNEIKIE